MSHIKKSNGKIHCERCSDWDWLKHHTNFTKQHENCNGLANKLNQSQRVEMISFMGDDTAGSLILPDVLGSKIEYLANEIITGTCDVCDHKSCIPKYVLRDEELENLLDQVSGDSGYMVKHSTLKFLVEKYVNALIDLEQSECQ